MLLDIVPKLLPEFLVLVFPIRSEFLVEIGSPPVKPTPPNQKIKTFFLLNQEKTKLTAIKHHTSLQVSHCILCEISISDLAGQS